MCPSVAMCNRSIYQAANADLRQHVPRATCITKQTSSAYEEYLLDPEKQTPYSAFDFKNTQMTTMVYDNKGLDDTGEDA